ncbi:hypothetical protein JQ554_23375 [Bradyrhizobium diazoefficiens]|nr:hypothetical protein [Bradyrhizobium diazoefficiens]MBR0966995.1 hypothetical protein [Bradyrhizobium diazoefficiens]MBR0979119.1 hypothetical protein [Bradyrhizobium diazoefficiens]MBR1009978.1 hypothetical protein [Bradyrhizobium diazoefficiens]MBR1016556.1 hypothetical protein [Bradyrhizobium diazoefficiens]MBR1053816.1 hypothetical protein [Bradyrhizobium diazoefficiens]
MGFWLECQARPTCRAVVLTMLLLGIAGCTRGELEHKADAYNQAIAESNNRQILLNAVRASQRAPMSFVGFGDVAATPTFSGAAGGTFNFDPLGLTTYNVNPTLNVNGGFTSFTMNNLNYAAFAQELQRPLQPSIVEYFDQLKFPKELVKLIFVQEYTLAVQKRQRIATEAAMRCRARANQRDIDICGAMERDRDRFDKAGCQDFPETHGTMTVLNVGRDLCAMVTFQTFVRQLRLLEVELPFKPRTTQAILYYLGDLIAAQNYSTHRFLPEVLIEKDNRRLTVPLFEVGRSAGVVAGTAVTVSYGGESFFIPTPAFGSTEEARSLQVLDLVSQVITAATSKDALPKTSTVTLVQAR